MAYDSMKPKGNGVYKLTVVSSQIEGYDNYAAAWMVYQFVATNNNVVVGRSESFTDVILTACNITPLLPPVLPPLRVVPTAITPPIIK